jgi:hypothetical protein
MSFLTNNPELNPEIKSFFSGIAAWSKENLYLTLPGTIAIYISTLIIIVIMIGLFVYYFRASRLFETQENISRLIRDAARGSSKYDAENPKRKSLRDYLLTLKSTNVPDAQLILGNMYVSTANAAGVFLPGRDGTVSPMAARAALLGGARAFVFDIWPDLTPGAQFAPILQVVESGSLWRRISMNSSAFITVLRTLVSEAFDITERPGAEDPLIFYLRFRGKPRATTYTGVANALRATIEPYRLGPSFNNCKSQDVLFTQILTNLFKKVVIISNHRAEGNALSDYINAGSKDGVKLEYTLSDIRGLSAENRVAAESSIKQNLTFLAPLSEDKAAEDNFAFKEAHDLGIHFAAMNFFNPNDQLKAYLGPDVFGTYSFKLKPDSLRYIVETLAKSKAPPAFGWGTGVTAGTPKIPPPIGLP